MSPTPPTIPSPAAPLSRGHLATLHAQAQLSRELVAIVREVWESFLLGEIEQVSDGPLLVPGLVTAAHVCLTGGWQGVVMVECEAPVAMELCCRLLGMDPGTASDLDVADTLGEIANVVGGNIKNVLPSPTVMSLPVVARSMSPTLVKDAVQICTVGFRWLGQDLRVIVWGQH